jgi:hypothetical protein
LTSGKFQGVQEDEQIMQLISTPGARENDLPEADMLRRRM